MSLKNLEILTLSFGRLRQRIVLKYVPHVQHDYFSSFNQSGHCFLASSLRLPSSLLKLPSDTRPPQLESSSGSARLAFGRGRGWRGRDAANRVCCWLMDVTDCRCDLLLFLLFLLRLPTHLFSLLTLITRRHLATAHEVQITKY